MNKEKKSEFLHEENTAMRITNASARDTKKKIVTNSLQIHVSLIICVFLFVSSIYCCGCCFHTSFLINICIILYSFHSKLLPIDIATQSTKNTTRYGLQFALHDVIFLNLNKIFVTVVHIFLNHCSATKSKDFFYHNHNNYL